MKGRRGDPTVLHPLMPVRHSSLWVWLGKAGRGMGYAACKPVLPMPSRACCCSQLITLLTRPPARPPPPPHPPPSARRSQRGHRPAVCARVLHHWEGGPVLAAAHLQGGAQAAWWGAVGRASGCGLPAGPCPPAAAAWQLLGRPACKEGLHKPFSPDFKWWHRLPPMLCPDGQVVALDRPDEPLIAKSCTGCWTGVRGR